MSHSTSTFAFAQRRRNSGRRSGSILVLMSLLLVVLSGFCALAVDLGLLYYTKAKLQIACDAGALAGAQEMPRNPSQALEMAQKTARANGVASPEVTFPNSQQVRVTAKRHIAFLFAPMLGIASNDVVATTLAGRSYAARGIPEVVPLSITTGAYENYRGGSAFEVRLVRANKDAFTNDRILALDFRTDSSGKSGSIFEEDLTKGYFNTVFINDNYNALTASENSQSANLIDAMLTRFKTSAAAYYHDTGINYVYPNYPPKSQRIITIAVSDEKPANNSNPVVPIRYFAPVYVENVWQTNGSDKETLMRLRILLARAYNSDDPRVVIGDSSTPDTGITVVKMAE